MGLPRALIVLLAALVPEGAAAQPVTSPAPDKVAVTIYRAPGGGELDLAWLRGYALVTETRTLAIPAGRATIRFEGVAGGILPESAIVTGLPPAVREKNLDADLLSPRSLYANSLGRPVTLRREMEGRVVEEPAIIRSGPDGAAILQTREGFVAANCGPDRERLVYGAVPPGLSAKPVLSVETDSAAAHQVTLTLSYLAWGFDWRANYVATMRPGGRSAELFAWVTLANGDVTGFPDAETMVVAGHVERGGSPDEVEGRYRSSPLTLRCFFRAVGRPQMAAPLPDAVAEYDGDIVVTGIRAGLESAQNVKRNAATVVEREELGDLNLYRVPHRTTIAARSQKQVGLLDRPSVDVEVIYRARIYRDGAHPATLLLRTRNTRAKGLGMPLPSGVVAVFEPSGTSQLLLGEGAIGDKAIDEEVEIETAEATQVTAEVTKRGPAMGKQQDYVLTVTNANPHPVQFEADIQDFGGEVRSNFSARIGRKNGRGLWAVRVPANGTRTLRYRVTEQ